ncbi:transposase [Pseudorhodoferax sp. Leaf267]|uniref:transposase n=1 Tax=Pseudorhodoferax sp. Leaf267 TaxID=1736316 RepID=UPI002100CCBE|nr:transposase [Pseudorhodoferax sp. Leaf267]
MTLELTEFMRRFSLHMLPPGLHRIRHYGLRANGCCRACLALARELLQVVPEPAGLDSDAAASAQQQTATFVCQQCGKPPVPAHFCTREMSD